MNSRRARRPIVLAALAVCSLANFAEAAVINFTITLDGSQETPAVNTAASGSGTATLDTATNQFSWNITFMNLSSAQTAAHFHGSAPQCEAAGVIIPLTVGSPIVGSATVTAQQATDIISGLWYVNVHTMNNTGGEIRGQVVAAEVADPIPAPLPMGSIHVQLQEIATGLTAPNWGVAAPGIAGRLFVTDQNGIVWNIELATGQKSVFADVSGLLVPLGAFGPGTFDERGLLGIAFHPAYATNGLVYLFMSRPVAGPADFSTIPVGQMANCQTVISEWHVNNPTNPLATIDMASSRELLRIDKPQFNHNAGGLAFGPDGLLYMSFGDGGGADDKDGQAFIGAPIIGHGCTGNGQNKSNPLGTILRIDPQGNNSANGHYGIPANNPFVGQMGVVQEIFAYGFRNPFRFSFDRMTGALYVGDVGQNDLEEIDVVVAGGNYGWRYKEGNFYFAPNGNANAYVTDIPQSVPAGLNDPIAQYDHSEGTAIIGGFAYRGTRITPLIGRYVHGEFAKTFNHDGRLFYLDPSNAIVEFPLVGQPALGLALLGFAEDAAGELYVLANATGTPFGTTGVVYRIGLKPGDINADGATSVTDLLAVINQWGRCPSPPTSCPADIAPQPDGDGQVNVNDLLFIINNWG